MNAPLMTSDDSLSSHRGHQRAFPEVSTAAPAGLLRAQGPLLIDDAGVRVPRGVGLGNWLLPEGYMWLFGPGAESPREIESLVSRRAGPDYAAQFWKQFRERYITEADIALIASLGYDHVRVPINSRVIQDEDGNPLPEGYRLLDNVVTWCTKHGLRALLDLHGAPGGQTGTNIDDSPHGRPDLFLEPGYAELTVQLWTDLARHFAGNHTVMGYDLLNEPLPNEWRFSLTPRLVDLYQRLTHAIREVDQDHLIVYEGTHWATDFSMFTQRWDHQQVLQFHRYWSSPDREGIAPFIEARDRLDMPLYMGEGGENTPEWIYTALRLYEAHGIGWNLWPWKKLATRTSPISITPPDGWEFVRQSIGGESALSESPAREIFDALLDACDVAAATQVDDVITASLGKAPRVIPAWGFGHHGEGVSYANAGESVLPHFRSSDAVTVRYAKPDSTVDNPFQQGDGRGYNADEELVVDLPAGAWLAFECDLDGHDPAAWEALDIEGATVDAELSAGPHGLVLAAQRGAVTVHRLFRRRARA